jgi:hypothetical protein
MWVWYAVIPADGSGCIFTFHRPMYRVGNSSTASCWLVPGTHEDN